MTKPPPEPIPTPSRALVLLLALAAGATVANLYYCQPVLGAIARDFGVSTSATSMLVTATQLGYAASLLLVVPLGDMFERRRLIVAAAVSSVIALLAVGLSPGLSFMLCASFVLGAASVTPQLVVPYAAGLTGPATRGRVVGVVMSGLLIGILLSRVLSGMLAAAAGWRTAYWVSAGMILGLSVTLRWFLPKQSPGATLDIHYGQLLVSLWDVFKREPVLRRHSFVGACGFAAFSAFWTTLAFHLANLPGHYGSGVAGLFGLLGATGALAAPVSGRLAERMNPLLLNGGALSLVVIAFLIMGFGGGSLIALIIGVVLMDAGVQGSHISNQARIFALAAELRNRCNSVYMVSYFIGGAAGSVMGSWAWKHGRWPWVCWCGALVAAIGVVFLFAGRHKHSANPRKNRVPTPHSSKKPEPSKEIRESRVRGPTPSMLNNPGITSPGQPSPFKMRRNHLSSRGRFTRRISETQDSRDTKDYGA